MDLKEEITLGDSIHTHWYYTSKARMLAAHVGKCRTVLDVGAGSGFFSRWLLREGLADSAICVDTAYREEIASQECGRPIAFRHSAEAAEADLLLMMDVLEHVDDDAALLRQYFEPMSPGATALITVPAFQFLWSAHDEFLGHKRRYTLGQICRLVRGAGAHAVTGHYYFGAILPLAAAIRLLQRARSPSRSDLRAQAPAINWILESVCRAEIAAMRWNKVGGLTAVVTCRR